LVLCVLGRKDRVRFEIEIVALVLLILLSPLLVGVVVAAVVVAALLVFIIIDISGNDSSAMGKKTGVSPPPCSQGNAYVVAS